MRDGFTVPPGAVLAGAALQTVDKVEPGGQPGDKPRPSIPLRRWSAVLGIDGPPLEVIHAFADQAASAGLETVSRRGCTAAQAVPSVPGTPALPPSPAHCGLTTTSPVQGIDVLQGAQLSVQIEVLPGRHAIGYMAFQEFGDTGSNPAPPTSSSTLPIPERFKSPPSVSLPAFRGPANGRIPNVGDPVGFDNAQIRVQRQSQMVVAAYSVSSGTSPDEALIRVTDGAPGEVFRAYLAAVKKAGMPRLHAVRPNHSAGWAVRTVNFNDGSEAGEVGGTAQLFTRPGRAYIRIYLYQG